MNALHTSLILSEGQSCAYVRLRMDIVRNIPQRVTTPWSQQGPFLETNITFNVFVQPKPHAMMFLFLPCIRWLFYVLIENHSLTYLLTWLLACIWAGIFLTNFLKALEVWTDISADVSFRGLSSAFILRHPWCCSWRFKVRKSASAPVAFYPERSN